MSNQFTPLVHAIEGTLDPAETCERFSDLPYVFFLDSAATDHPDAHYSFLAADPICVVRSTGEATEVSRRPGGAWSPVSGDALSVARALLPVQPVDPIPGLPPFQGGIGGYIG
jgi:anthranilate/para-aminobenzoate synthase component I